VRAGARARFEPGDVPSCCAPAGTRRRSKEELCNGEPFDDAHDSAAEGTVPWRVSGEGSRGGRALSVLLWSLEQTKTQWKKLGSSPIGQEAEVADAVADPRYEAR